MPAESGWHLDVSRHILGLEGIPGLGCSPSESGTQALGSERRERQFGLYLSWAYEICVALTLVREDRVGPTPLWFTGCAAGLCRRVSKSGSDKR